MLLTRFGRRAVLIASAATIGVSATVLILDVAKSPSDPVPPLISTRTDAGSSPQSRATPDPVRAEPRPGAANSRSAARPMRPVQAAPVARPGVLFTELAIAGVRARVGIGRLTLLVTATRPVDVRVRVTGGFGFRQERATRLIPGSSAVSFTGLPPGLVRWRLMTTDEPAITGRAMLPGLAPATPTTPVPPAGSPTPPAPAPPVPAATPTKPTPKPDRPPQSTTPKPKPKPKKPPYGAGGTGGTLQPKPYDPDTDPRPGRPVDPNP